MNQTNNRAVYGKSHVSLVLHICSFLYNKQTKNLVTTKGRHLGDNVFLSKVPTSVKIAKCLRRWFLRLFPPT